MNFDIYIYVYSYESITTIRMVNLALIPKVSFVTVQPLLTHPVPLTGNHRSAGLLSVTID